ncbi:hypothetical protein [Haloplanus halobius]|uniref:hypothetical protein n=1 Tax=Haloplanus halobius TaxID=2934938 RepID=UPI0024B03DC2|nr:hypothetical protein [Haloplanus sp. XH21]
MLSTVGATTLGYAAVGVGLGTLSGLTPGLHANNFALLLASVVPSLPSVDFGGIVTPSRQSHMVAKVGGRCPSVGSNNLLCEKSDDHPHASTSSQYLISLGSDTHLSGDMLFHDYAPRETYYTELNTVEWGGTSQYSLILE